MRSRFRRIRNVPDAAAIAALALLSVGCAGRQETSAGPPDAACIVTDGETPAQLRVGVPDPVRAEDAPIPRNSSERLVFGHLYETLVRVGCNGALEPGLAEAWSVAENGRAWTFRLRADAAFTEGSPANAPAVIGVWRSNRATSEAIDSLFAAVTAQTPQELRILLRDSAATPRLFAQPLFAVARRVARGWPTGTGAYRVGASSAQQIRLLPRVPMRPTIDVLVTGSDARSALDSGIDAIVSGDTRTIEYARVLPGYLATPLPWSRTYVLLGTTADSTSAISAISAIPAIPADVRGELAREAVRGDVRPAEPPFWWAACGSPAAPRSGDTRVIAYAADDSLARGLAERIAALAWPASRTPEWLRPFIRAGERAPTVQPMNAQALNDASRRDAGTAIIAAMPRDGDCSATGPTGSRRGAALVDARDHFIHRGDIGRVVVDGDGTLRFGVVR